MEPGARDKVLKDFREQVTRFLVTTNVLSRGIDVAAVTLVINYDMPVKKGGTSDPDTYARREPRCAAPARRPPRQSARDAHPRALRARALDCARAPACTRRTRRRVCAHARAARGKRDLRTR
jgi:hypothetical protein